MLCDGKLMGEGGSTLRNHKLIFFFIFLLAVILIGAGLRQTYQVISGTLGRPIPALWGFQASESQWEMDVLGSHYAIKKDNIKPDKLLENAKLLVQEVGDQGRELWQKIIAGE